MAIMFPQGIVNLSEEDQERIEAAVFQMQVMNDMNEKSGQIASNTPRTPTGAVARRGAFDKLGCVFKNVGLKTKLWRKKIPQAKPCVGLGVLLADEFSVLESDAVIHEAHKQDAVQPAICNEVEVINNDASKSSVADEYNSLSESNDARRSFFVVNSEPISAGNENNMLECEVRSRGVQLRDDGLVPGPDNYERHTARQSVPQYCESSLPRPIEQGRRRSQRFSLDGDCDDVLPTASKVCETLALSPVNPNPVISTGDFEFKCVLGAGAQGRVYAATSSVAGSKKLLAVKVMNKRTVYHQNVALSTLLEQIALKQVRGSKFILELEASFHDTENFYLVTPFYTGGDLSALIKQTGQLSVEATRFYAAEITCGIQYLHKNNIIHRDIKPSNILIKGDGHIVLSDFGLIKAFDYEPVGGAVSWRPAKKIKDERSIDYTRCGTLCFMAPEMFCNGYSFEVDWWAFGVTVVDMLVGVVPWSNKCRKPEDYYMLVCHSTSIRDFLNTCCDADVKDFLEGLLVSDPLSRFSAKNIYTHAFFGPVNWDDVEAEALTPPFIPVDYTSTILSMTLADNDRPLPGYIPLYDSHPEYTFIGVNLQRAPSSTNLLSTSSFGTPDVIPQPMAHVEPALHVSASSRMRLHSRTPSVASSLSNYGFDDSLPLVEPILSRCNERLTLCATPHATTICPSLAPSRVDDKLLLPSLSGRDASPAPSSTVTCFSHNPPVHGDLGKLLLAVEAVHVMKSTTKLSEDATEARKESREKGHRDVRNWFKWTTFWKTRRPACNQLVR
ncbi:hypothetical protein AMATHDRAFT_50599 [Amanita thiersii Skay4041]|uniref:non-specific serine/threonine protein kinase n=1 Tax=Amanita thiersii Skay4041 TaxID=703135 RepID=A0A2A9NAC8_9AGAR|nr:hypothetical protein AMATHDRAFT_50599 [Amanita thiersii Skay4041]